MNLHAQFIEAVDTADYTLLISGTDENGNNACTIASMKVDDPNLQVRLRDICQAYRMGARYGKERRDA